MKVGDFQWARIKLAAVFLSVMIPATYILVEMWRKKEDDD